MTPADLTAVGEALYGPRWHAELARQLGITYRTLRRWMTGEHPVPDGVRADLVRLTDEAWQGLALARARLGAATLPPPALTAACAEGRDSQRARQKP